MSSISSPSGNARQHESSSRWEQVPTAGEVVEGTKTTIADHAVSSVALCFGLGFGAGVLIGISLSHAYASPKQDRWVAERYGRQVMDAVSSVLPASLGGKA